MPDSNRMTIIESVRREETAHVATAANGDRALRAPIRVNGRTFDWPKRPTVVICYDGCDPEYIKAAREAHAVPTMERMIQAGFSGCARAAMPTFTNPNNLSIVCGAPPFIHGVSGNYYLDRETNREVMMVDATPVRAPTILSVFSQAGANVVAITAKDKLRKALGKDLRGVAFSAEKSGSCTREENGIENVCGIVGRAVPDQYSADLSLFVLDAGVALLRTSRPDLMYLSLSDYVQHKHPPESDEAISFMRNVDDRLAGLLDLGATVGIVADHGMSDMAFDDGKPRVVFLADRLDAEFSPGATRVICPITDPFVRHHGALGGFVRVYIRDSSLDPKRVLHCLRSCEGVALALFGAEASALFYLPVDREGDIAVIADKGFALGGHAVDHDLTQLAGERLRSHGGIFEQEVPFILSHPLSSDYAGRAKLGLRNFDIFEYAINGVE